MTYITAQDETFFIIAPHHADFIRDESASLREPILSGWRRLMFFFILVVAIITALPVLFPPKQYDVVAVITDKAIEGSDFAPQYRLTYQYTDHRDETHEVSRLTGQVFYDELAVGSVVTARYLEGQSHRATLSGRYSEDVYGLNSDFLWFLALILLVLWMLIFWLILPQRANQRLRYEGTLLKGVMTNIYPVKSFRRYDVTVEYTFAAMNGRVIEARARHNRRDLEHEQLPKYNTPVLVLYVNDNLYRLM